MSSFTTPLRYEVMDDGLHWKILEEFDYERGKLGSGDIIRVPAGFVTDGASVPRIFWNIFPPVGKYGKAAVLHDFLYWEQAYTRLEADNLLLEAMDALGVDWLTQLLIFRGVRLGGWVAWNQHKRENAARVVEDVPPAST